jgi:UDP-3-O-[3-hydroxymyristoyl] glucosamine N-acyltransferase
VPPGATLSGYPARPHREVLKATADVRGLDRLKERLKRLEEEVRELRESTGPKP